MSQVADMAKPAANTAVVMAATSQRAVRATLGRISTGVSPCASSEMANRRGRLTQKLAAGGTAGKGAGQCLGHSAYEPGRLADGLRGRLDPKSDKLYDLKPGIALALPVLLEARYIFGLLAIVWFIWLGIVMFRTRPLLAHSARS